VEIKLEKAGIVLFAKAHNPSIISPDWIKKYELIDEEPEKFLHTPEVSIFTSRSIHVVLDRNQLQVTTSKKDEESQLKVANFVKRYITNLPHYLYEWIDLNFLWTIQKDDKEEFPKVKLQIGTLNDIDISSKLFPNHELNYGSIIYAISQLYFLRLTISQRDIKTIDGYFSYHHSKEALENNKSIDIIDSFINMLQESFKIVEKIYLGKGS
jgi:hypothetical protein